MLHFVAFKSDTYTLRFPAYPNASVVKTSPKWINLQIENFIVVSDNFVLGVQYDGSVTPSKVHLSPGGSGDFNQTHTRVMTPVASRALVASGTGNTFLRDKANNMIWVRVTPYSGNFWPDGAPNSDDDLYRVMSLRI